MEKNVSEKVVIIKLAPVKLLPCCFLSTPLSLQQQKNVEKKSEKIKINNIQSDSFSAQNQNDETDNDLILDSHIDNMEALISTNNNDSSSQFPKRPTSESSTASISTSGSATDIESFIIRKENTSNVVSDNSIDFDNDLLDSHINSDISFFSQSSTQSAVSEISNNRQSNNPLDFVDIDSHLNCIIVNNSSQKSEDSDEEIIESQVLHCQQVHKR